MVSYPKELRRMWPCWCLPQWRWRQSCFWSGKPSLFSRLLLLVVPEFLTWDGSSLFHNCSLSSSYFVLPPPHAITCSASISSTCLCPVLLTVSMAFAISPAMLLGLAVQTALPPILLPKVHSSLLIFACTLPTTPLLCPSLTQLIMATLPQNK